MVKGLGRRFRAAGCEVRGPDSDIALGNRRRACEEREA